MALSEVKHYSPEIDGLRAIAVLSVLFFHLDAKWFGGGFVGVDVFFVISGYLITKNIANDIHHKKFSFKSFFYRRFFRLFPALLVTISATLFLSLFILTPEHLSRAAKVSIQAVLSISNFFFWAEAGYFDEVKVFKPFLHTWSLAVEEQFYLFWPLFLFLVCKYKTKTIVISLLLLGIVSAISAQVILDRDSAMAFYWMPFRIFEFVIGALLFFAPTANHKGVIANTLALLGMFLIFIAVTRYSNATTFPGVSTLIPCIGAALIIRYGRAIVVYQVLSNRLSLFIGRISYSLYLVHWPVIVLFSYWKLGGLGIKSFLLLLPIVFVLAVALHRFVEQPFRVSASRNHSPIFIKRLVFATMVVLLTSASMVVGKGWSWRYSLEAQAIVAASESLDTSKEKRASLLNSYNQSFQPLVDEPYSIIIGDSFAEDSLIAIKFARPKLNIKLLRVKAECQPLIPGDYAESNQVANDCNKERAKIFLSDILNEASTIYIAASWREPSFSVLDRTLSYLKKKTAARIVVFGPRASFHDVPTLALRHGTQDGLSEFVNKFKLTDIHAKVWQLKELVLSSNVEFIDTYKLMCPNELCPILSPKEGKLIYSDHAHLTVWGAEYLSSKLSGKL